DGERSAEAVARLQGARNVRVGCASLPPLGPRGGPEPDVHVSGVAERRDVERRGPDGQLVPGIGVVEPAGRERPTIRRIGLDRDRAEKLIAGGRQAGPVSEDAVEGALAGCSRTLT